MQLQSLEKKGCRKKKRRSFRNFPRRRAEYKGNLKPRKQTETSKFLRDMFMGETQNMGVTWWVLEPSRTEFKF